MRLPPRCDLLREAAAHYRRTHAPAASCCALRRRAAVCCTAGCIARHVVPAAPKAAASRQPCPPLCKRIHLPSGLRAACHTRENAGRAVPMALRHCRDGNAAGIGRGGRSPVLAALPACSLAQRGYNTQAAPWSREDTVRTMWQQLLAQWIRREAQGQLFQAAAQAAAQALGMPASADATGGTQSAEPAAAGASQAAAPAAPACDVGVVFALAAEAGGLVDLLAGRAVQRTPYFTVHVGQLQQRLVAVFESGVGRAAAARATEALLDVHRPAWVISAGFCGGLDARLRRGDILLADALLHASGEKLAIDLKVDPAELAGRKGLHVGTLLTVDRIVRSPAQKQELGRQYQALAVDMESFAAAEICRQRRARLLSVRIVSDTVEDELPVDLEVLARQRTRSARLGAAAAALWNRPGSVWDMLQLKELALIASDRLARFLSGMIEQLGPPPAQPCPRLEHAPELPPENRA